MIDYSNSYFSFISIKSSKKSVLDHKKWFLIIALPKTTLVLGLVFRFQLLNSLTPTSRFVPQGLQRPGFPLLLPARPRLPSRRGRPAYGRGDRTGRTDRSRTQEGGGLQQGDAPEDQAGPGDLPQADGADPGRAVERAGPVKPAKNYQIDQVL